MNKNIKNIKKNLLEMQKEALLIESKLIDFLFNYHLVPHKCNVGLYEIQTQKYIKIHIRLGRLKHKNKEIFKKYFKYQAEQNLLKVNVLNKHAIVESVKGFFSIAIVEKVNTALDMNLFYNGIFGILKHDLDKGGLTND